MCQIVSGCLNITTAIDEMMRMLGSSNGIQHNREITAGRILHTNRYIHSAGGKTMLLVFDRTCTDCFIGEDIIEVTSVFRVKHFISRGKSCFLHYAHMHLANCDDSGKKIRCLVRIRLMKHSLVAVSCSTWFIGINTRNNH